MHLGTDASRVRHWLAGQHPQSPAPEVLSELFSEQLGYPVLPAELGLPASLEHGLGLWYSESVTATVVALAELGRYDVLRRNFLHQALRLAQESGDTALGAAVLVGMSHQALILGYPRETLQLAITGRHGLVRAYNPVGAAGLWAAQAQAHAALGDTAAAVHAVIESERAFENSDTRAGTGRSRFIDNAHLSGLWAEAFAALQRPVEAARFARRSISAAADQNRGRREALSQITLARTGLARHDLDTILRAAHRAIDLSTTVQSSRCITTLRDLRFQISPYRTVRAVREFDERARDVLTPPHLN